MLSEQLRQRIIPVKKIPTGTKPQSVLQGCIHIQKYILNALEQKPTAGIEVVVDVWYGGNENNEGRITHS